MPRARRAVATLGAHRRGGSAGDLAGEVLGWADSRCDVFERIGLNVARFHVHRVRSEAPPYTVGALLEGTPRDGSMPMTRESIPTY